MTNERFDTWVIDEPETRPVGFRSLTGMVLTGVVLTIVGLLVVWAMVLLLAGS